MEKSLEKALRDYNEVRTEAWDASFEIDDDNTRNAVQTQIRAIDETINRARRCRIEETLWDVVATLSVSALDPVYRLMKQTPTKEESRVFALLSNVQMRAPRVIEEYLKAECGCTVSPRLEG